MRHLGHRASALLGTAALLAGFSSTTGTAQASTGPAATPESVCGSGYTVRDQRWLVHATVWLLRNGNSACVVTFKEGSAIGNDVVVGAWVESRTGGLRGDKGRYSYYAGPVKITASCVHWGGEYGPYSGSSTPCW
ncbi:hypothetical protein [Streptomyces clavuligerus]|uniref:Negative regulator of beta-lactamase expression n=1 Tax=Streptomyces clavuligerus TaxID=1901 RepID=B5GM51_STRCL|nr:hypothetical protein [Streptomyces clavuligerus]EDY47397.1 hypothetical protein SSCG_00425 [Streptomyces clavuligerus]EFG05054.1 Negative regulator of beta-lactamase expression [Streptomyces clavuligerus]MBY6306539.1 serine/threonine protein kinase [Streptomyces clavuligerus]QCS10851.1 serine/threonine protein kinase [Streptomyces clavuligerus]QPJ97108.1 serine/threonine protein kinase [Streptomyces clavuligerus]